MPKIWNPQDTMFVVVPEEGGNIDIAVNSFDTNGTIVQYYWKFYAPFDTSNATKGTYSVYRNLLISAPSVNVDFKMAVFCKDDDGLMAGDT